MAKPYEIDHYHRIIPIIDNMDECILIVPTTVLNQSNMGIGDKFIVIPKKDKLILKKMKQD